LSPARILRITRLKKGDPQPVAAVNEHVNLQY